MKIEGILKQSISILKENEIEEPSLKARILLAYILKIPKEKLVLCYDKKIEKENE